MSQEIDATSGAEGQAPLIRSIKREEFEMKRKHKGMDMYRWVTARLFTVEFTDGEARRYLVGAATISREFEDIPFWTKSQEAVEDYLNAKLIDYPEDPYKSFWYIRGTKQEFRVDEKDVSFYKWFMNEREEVEE